METNRDTRMRHWLVLAGTATALGGGFASLWPHATAEATRAGMPSVYAPAAVVARPMFLAPGESALVTATPQGPATRLELEVTAPAAAPVPFAPAFGGQWQVRLGDQGLRDGQIEYVVHTTYRDGTVTSAPQRIAVVPAASVRDTAAREVRADVDVVRAFPWGDGPGALGRTDVEEGDGRLPAAIAVARGTGAIHLVDTANGRITSLAPSGDLAGTAAIPAAIDPSDAVVDPASGDLLVVDQAAARVTRLRPDAPGSSRLAVATTHDVPALRMLLGATRFAACAGAPGVCHPDLDRGALASLDAETEGPRAARAPAVARAEFAALDDAGTPIVQVAGRRVLIGGFQRQPALVRVTFPERVLDATSVDTDAAGHVWMIVGTEPAPGAARHWIARIAANGREAVYAPAPNADPGRGGMTRRVATRGQDALLLGGGGAGMELVRVRLGS